MSARNGLGLLSTVFLTACIASPLGGGLVANLYTWDDRNNPVYSTLTSTDDAFDGFMEGSIDLKRVLLENPDFPVAEDQPYLLEVCNEECLYLVLFPGDFSTTPNGEFKGIGVLSPLSTSMYLNVNNLPAHLVRERLDRLAVRLLSGDKVKDGKVDYLDVVRLDYQRSARDASLFSEALLGARLDWDFSKNALVPINAMLEDADCFEASAEAPGFTALPDLDGDSYCDLIDDDIDGDLVPNERDAFAYDASEFADDDGDGIGNAAERSETIYYVVSQAVADELETELQTFMDDVSADTGASPLLLVEPESAAEVREQFRAAYAQQSLVGAFLIGDVPIITTNNLDFNVGLNVSDHPLRALNCPYEPDEDDPSIWNFPSNVSVRQECLPDIWVARLLPPRRDASAIEKLRHYFEKNHALRDEATAERSLYFGQDLPREMQDDFVPVINTVFSDHPLYTVDEITLNQSTVALDHSQGWMAAIQENRDLVKMNVHGSPTRVQFQGADLDDYINVTSDEVARLDINARVIEMTSCSVGRFDREGYLAGTLLFEGDALLVRAFPAVTLISRNSFEDQFNYRDRALGMGQSFAETYRYFYSGSPTHFFGDPTIRLRPQTQSTVQPRISIKDKFYDRSFDVELEFSDVSDDEVGTQALEISNTGTDMLVLRGKFIGLYTRANGDRIPGSNGFVFSLPEVRRSGFDYEVEILPGETTPLVFAFKPSANRDDSLPTGAEYDALFRVYTNDPRSPAFFVNVRGTHLKSGG